MLVIKHNSGHCALDSAPSFDLAVVGCQGLGICSRLSGRVTISAKELEHVSYLLAN